MIPYCMTPFIWNVQHKQAHLNKASYGIGEMRQNDWQWISIVSLKGNKNVLEFG